MSQNARRQEKNGAASARAQPSVYRAGQNKIPSPSCPSGLSARPSPLAAAIGPAGFIRSISSPSGSLRAQAAVEVLIYLGFFLLVFVSLTLMFLMQVSQDISQREYALSASVAAQVGQGVELALLAGPGFNATFPIPARIAGQPYELYFTDAGYLYINLTLSNPASPPVQYYFPFTTRRLELGCAGDAILCPDNALLTYTDTKGQARTAWRVGTSAGVLRIANRADEAGLSILQVG